MSFLSDILRNWRQVRGVIAEMDGLCPAAVSEPGLSRADLRRVAQMPAEQIARMELMAGVFGLDEGALWDHRAELSRVCAQCREHGPCRRALTGNAPASDCGFCPNAPTFAMLAPVGR